MTNIPDEKERITVLVIDDDRDRDEVYEEFFSKFASDPSGCYLIVPRIPKTPKEAVAALLSREAALVVLDLRLDQLWEAHAETLIGIMRDQRTPVALLSMDFNDPVVSGRAQRALSSLRDVPKLGFLPYMNSIYGHCRDANGAKRPDALPEDPVIIWNLMCAEAKNHGHYWTPRRHDGITMFHLTDTHFGAMKPDLVNAVAIANGAKRGNLVADFLIWTGDITEHGLPEEFRLAQKFVDELRNVGVLEPFCPIAMCPGNHDLCRPLALASKLEWIEEDAERDGKRRRDESKKRRAWRVKDDAVNGDLWEYGTQPYREFFTCLTGDRAPLPSDGYRFLTQWVHYGFAVLEFPIEAHIVPTRSDQHQPKPFIDEALFKAVTERVITVIKNSKLAETTCLIVLLHGRDPDQPDTYARRTDELMTRVMEFGYPTIVVGGHEHLRDHVIHHRRLTIIGAPADESKADRLTLPSIGFIRLSNLGTTSLTCEVTPLSKSAGDRGVTNWDSAKSRRFELSSRSKNWDDVSQVS